MAKKTPEDLAMFASLLEDAKKLDTDHPYFAVAVEPEVEAKTHVQPFPTPHPVPQKG